MMSEIYARGPVVCSVATPEAFDYGYRAGIYDDPLNYTRDAIDHNVEVRIWASEVHLQPTSFPSSEPVPGCLFQRVLCCPCIVRRL